MATFTKTYVPMLAEKFADISKEEVLKRGRDGV